jgi:hypothetical protein
VRRFCRKMITTALYPSGNHPITKSSSEGLPKNPWNPCAKNMKFFGLVQRTSGRKDPNTERWTVGPCKTNHRDREGLARAFTFKFELWYLPAIALKKSRSQRAAAKKKRSRDVPFWRRVSAFYDTGHSFCTSICYLSNDLLVAFSWEALLKDFYMDSGFNHRPELFHGSFLKHVELYATLRHNIEQDHSVSDPPDSHIELMCVAVESGIVRQCQESSSHTDFHVPLFASITEIQISYTILDDRNCGYALVKVCKLHLSLHQPIYMRGYGRNCSSYPTSMIM